MFFLLFRGSSDSVRALIIGRVIAPQQKYCAWKCLCSSLPSAGFELQSTCVVEAAERSVSNFNSRDRRVQVEVDGTILLTQGAAGDRFKIVRLSRCLEAL